MSYPSNEQTITEVDPMTARNVLGWLGQLVEVPGQMKALQEQAALDRQAYTDQIQRLEAKITEVTSRNSELASQVARVVEENEALKRETRYIVAERDASRQEVRTLNDTIRVKNTEIGGLETALRDTADTINRKQGQITDLEATVLDQETEIGTLKATIARLQGKIDRMVRVAQDEAQELQADAKEGQPPAVTEQGPAYRPFASEAKASFVSGVNQGDGSPAYSFEGQRDPEHEADRRERGEQVEKGRTSFDPFAA